MKSLPLYLALSATAFSFAVSALSVGAQSDDPLAAGFRSPPDSARPETWWHWMNGNITAAGIDADLHAMKDIGLGGATIVNVDCGIPAGDTPFMGSAWRDRLKQAVQTANTLGLELCIENCAGWSSSGGPWNTPENAMQRVTTSEVRVTGPAELDQGLPQPATKLDFYRDVAVLAFPADPTEGENRMAAAHPTVTASAATEAAQNLLQPGNRVEVRLPLPKKHQAEFVQITFAEPFAARTVTLTPGQTMPDCKGAVEVSDDGTHFRTLQPFDFSHKASALRLISLGDQPVSARFWRIAFTGVSGKPKTGYLPLREIGLNARQSIDNVQAKDGSNGNFTLSADAPNPGGPVAGAVGLASIVDLTAKLAPDGRLHWSVPAGDWVILRVGYTPTEVHNHPAPAAGDGLECDKFSTAALDAHWNGFMQKILDDLGPLGGKTLNCSLIDSYEVGGQNWSGNFRAEFKQRRGYDPVKYLPAFTGRVVENPAVSERFLWDIRRTIADLFAEKYFQHFADLCRQHGLLNAVEPYTGPFESLQCGKPADVVMGEFWSGSQGHPSVKLAASVAHIYGKTVVGAESFTASPEPGRWQNDPYSLKTLGDLMFCRGLNRCVFHRYAMQPWTNRWPGMTMGQWGFHFERTVTWWEQGKAWINYLTHCQYMLQQGRAVADVAYFTGESTPVEMREGNPALPAGYDYDAVNADVLLHGAKVRDGRIVLASGASYAALVLPPQDVNMTPRMLEGIRTLVRDGATVVGPRPVHSPSLQDYPQCDATVGKVAGELWGDINGVSVTEHADGAGRVVWGKGLAEVFAGLKLAPDFEVLGAGAARVAYGHRVAGEDDLYFVSNQRRQFDGVDCAFRISGKAPELWHPDTGRMEPAPVWHEQDGRTVVHLDLDPAGSVFVVFRQPAAGVAHWVAATGRFAPATASGSKLEIRKAGYAAQDGTGQPMDVTAVVAAAAAAGQAIEVGNDAFGNDPAYLHVKELTVDYVLDGKPGQVKLAEGRTFLPPGTASVGEAPKWSVGWGAQGMPQVKVWGAGQVELQDGAGVSRKAEAQDVPAPETVAGPWTLSFPPNWGAPATVSLDKLISWTDHPDNGVKYFSGTATYERELEIPAARLAAGRELWLDLGTVKNFAEVNLNGQDLGVLWKPPFRVELTGVAHPGANHLKVKVTNLWVNRLIGDEQLPDDREWDGKQLKAWPDWVRDGRPSPTGRFTFTTWHHWTKSDQPLDSGLLGPVRLETAELIPLP